MKLTNPANALFHVFEVVLVLAILGLVLLVFVARPFGPATRTFDSLKGSEAQAKLGDDWPSGVKAADVASVSLRGQSSIDSHSYWYRIELTPAAARAWQDSIHAAKENSIKSAAKSEETAEGVHREVPGPISFRHQTGDEPDWWAPPASSFRATEGVKWTPGDRTAYGYGLYSLFDEGAGLLWVYDYFSQHDQLWAKGDIPAGEVFTIESPSSPAVAKARLGDRWPTGVALKDVSSCQFDEASVRFDNDWGKATTSWLKVKLTPEAATVWENSIHAREVERIRHIQKLNRLVEGVQRTTNGRLPLRMEVGGRPSFWDPPPANYRTTEGMIWGIEPAIPTGMALYSWFDQATGVLWVYQNSSPRDVLWPQGKIPEGTEIVNPEADHE